MAWLTPEGLKKLEAWARDGLSDEQIAHNCGLKSISTFYEWKNKYPEFSEALKKGKEIVDLEVENAMLKRALGYQYDEIKEKWEDGEITERVVITREIPPDTTAQIYWLKNRKPEKWRDRPAYEPEGETLKKAKELLGGIDSAID